ncbi:MAG: hypothetical protein ABSG62_12840 [Terracidiphilus sp.]|jgi:hypothetical protein
MPLLDQIRETKLIELAKTRFSPDLTPAELKVLHDSASSEDLPEPDEKVPRPEVRAAFLRWLATDPGAAPHIDPKGLRVYAAIIPGMLDLSNCHVNPPLDFRRCNFQGEINLLSAETRGLFFLDSSLAVGILADRVIIHGPLYLPNIQSEGEIRLLGAEITGQLNCNGAKLSTKGDAFSADGAKIGGDVALTDGFETEGALRLPGAEISGDLWIRGAKVAGVICHNTVIKGDLAWHRIEKSKDTGLDLKGAKVKNLRDDKMSWPDEGNLHLDGLVYEGLKLYEPSSDENIKNNTYSKEMPLVARDRIAWLELQPEKGAAAAQPWVQLANLLNASGDPEGAREVLYAYRRRSRGRNVLLRGGTYPTDHLEQWPLDIWEPIAALGLLGSLIFWRAHRMSMMAPAEKEAFKEFHETGKLPERYAPFSPIIYTLENVLPVVELGQDSAWYPNPQAAPGSLLPDWPKWLKNTAERWALTRWVFRLNYRRLAALRWSLILLGWALAIILAGAISGLFKP